MIRLSFALIGLLWLRPAWAEPPVWQRPVAAGCVSSGFGWRHQVGPRAPAGMHLGIDLPAPAGEWVRAAAEGEVVEIRKHGVGGLFVVIRHPDGWQSLYAHLGSVAPALANGQRHVSAGERIGRIGRSGITYGTHLYFQLSHLGEAVDPTPLLALTPCP